MHGMRELSTRETFVDGLLCSIFLAPLLGIARQPPWHLPLNAATTAVPSSTSLEIESPTEDSRPVGVHNFAAQTQPLRRMDTGVFSWA